MSPQEKPRIRVAQWATGTVGAFAMRAVIEHPGMELVGVRVYSAKKEGKDAGELCGLSPVGVAATRDIEDIVAAKPHCVLYMPESTDVADLCRLLASGINVVTTRPEFFHPDVMDPPLRAAIEAACASGGSSIHSTGSSPGFITEALPVAIVSMSRRVDLLDIEEFANCLEGCSEEMLTGLMGFGDTPEAFARRHTPDHAAFERSLGMLAAAMGLPLASFETTVEGAVCRNETFLRTKSIPAGSVGAQRVSVTGFRDGKPLMRFSSNWYVTTDVDCDWDLRSDGWRISLMGDAPVEMTINLPMPIEESMRASARYTAHRPVNAIPSVVAAAPGIITTPMLPAFAPRLA